MKRILFATLIALALNLVPCAYAKDPAAVEATKHEQIANQFVDAMQDVMMSALDAKDLESAKQAAAKITKLKATIDKLAEELKPLEVPSLEDRKAITKKMEARMEAMQNEKGEKMAEALMALDDESKMLINQAMRDFFQNLNLHENTFKKHFQAEEE